jgi:2-polyprenyl-3-methyl-5-hydroxy-6-metoxy-1,4-benzoquinol methylase
MGWGFSHRRRLLVPELMDAERVAPEDLQTCLADLERLSRWTLGYQPTLSWFARQMRVLPRDRPVTVVDVACGGGDMLRALARLAHRLRAPVRLVGIDLNPVMTEVARRLTPSGAGIEYRTGNALEALPVEADFIVSALFVHHLDDDEAVRFLRNIDKSARRGWLISDLHRHVVSYAFLRVVPRLIGMHRFVVHDGAVSVARGWSAAELHQAAARADIPRDRYRLRWRLPFRWTLEGRAA